jgi:uncharacterized membrane protein YhdT
VQAQEQQRQARWAPWWVYVIAIVVTNQLRTQLLMPDDLPTWLELVIGVGSIALVATLVTAAYRATRTPRRGR